MAEEGMWLSFSRSAAAGALAVQRRVVQQFWFADFSAGMQRHHGL
jgi:hypothetical protein